MFAHQIRPTEVSLVLYIVEEIARDANFRPVSTEKSKELARSPLARYSHHDPGDRARAWCARPPDRSGCSTAARNGKACFTVLVTRNSRGRRGTIYENDTKTIDDCTAWRGDAHCGCGRRR